MEPPDSEIEKRLSGLENRVESIQESLDRIQERLARIETTRERSGPVPGPAGESESGASSPWKLPEIPRVALAPMVTLTGQSCLILCGAFLLRALTEQKILPESPGLTIGFVYAVAWLVVSELSARGGRQVNATFYGAASVIIIYRLIWEATTDYELFDGDSAAAVLAGLSACALSVTWRRGLRFLAWIVMVLALATSFALLVKTHRMEPYNGVLLLLGAGSVWLAYVRGWTILRWPAALAADLGVLVMALQASRETFPPEQYPDLSPTWVLVLALSLLFVYLASFAIHTLLRKQQVTMFELVQTGLVLAVGLGGAVRVVEAREIGTVTLGGVALVLAVSCYGVAFALTEARWGRRRNFMFYAWLAFVLTLVGSSLVTRDLFATLTWCVLGIVVALFGTFFGRKTLHYHGVVYIGAAAFTSGLVVSSVELFTSPNPPSGFASTLGGLGVLAAIVACYAILAAAGLDPRRPWSSRIPRVVVAILGALGCGALAVVALRSLVEGPVQEPDPALLASIRSSVLATAALVLAVLGRWSRCAELRWLVYPLLVGGGIKLIAEDLPAGRPMTLFPAFAFYGLALIITPYLVHTAQRADSPADEPRPATPGAPARSG